MNTALSAPQQQPTAPTAQDLKDQGPDWKRQLAERLDAYRSKHPDAISQPASTTNTLANSRASKIARSVASRYAASPTYSELLLAAAEKAAAEARAVLAERLAWDARVAEEAIAEAEERAIAFDGNQVRSASNENSFGERHDPAAQVQPGTPVMPQFAARSQEMRMHQVAPEPEPSLEDLWASSLIEPRTLLPSKLIEFPRELISSRRARPRLPENPDGETESASPSSESPQLRIFEVQPGEDIPVGEAAAAEPARNTTETSSFAPSSTEVAARDASHDAAPVTMRNSAPAESKNVSRAATNRGEAVGATRTAVPIYGRSEAAERSASSSATARAFKNLEWAAISLDKEPTARNQQPQTSVTDYVPFLVDPASIDRRLMAFAVDFAAVTAGFLGFLVIFVASTPHLPTGFAAAALAAGVYAALWLLYQMLFFSLSGATAGMLYARIALCTFDDRNPTRAALRRRLAAWWLSCLPLGIGFLWCFVDEDNLSWHDRMTGMYQRRY